VYSLQCEAEEQDDDGLPHCCCCEDVEYLPEPPALAIVSMNEYLLS
jgi:hypothetical protein